MLLFFHLVSNFKAETLYYEYLDVYERYDGYHLSLDEF